MSDAIRAQGVAVTLSDQPMAVRERHAGFLRKSGLRRLLRSCSLFQHLPDERLDELAASSRVQALRSRQTLSDPGDKGPGVCLVKNGALKVISTPRHGREVIHSLLEAGDLFGEFSALSLPPGPLHVLALRRSEILILPADEFRQLLLHDTGVRKAALRLTVTRIRQAERALRRMALLAVHDRVEDILRQIGEERGRPHDDGTEIRRRPSQSALAGLAGSTRETVSRALKDLEERRVITCTGRRVVVHPVV